MSLAEVQVQPQPHGQIEPMACPYTRAVPEGWDNLTDIAADLVAEHGKSPVAAEGLLPYIDKLDDDLLSAQLYYGMGLIMNGMALSLHNPVTSDRIVNTAAQTTWANLIALAPSRRASGIRANDLRAVVTHAPFEGIALEAAHNMPFAERLVTNTLAEARVARYVEYNYDGCEQTDLRQGLGRRALNAEMAVRIVGVNALGGLTLVHVRALKELEGQMLGRPVSSKEDTGLAVRDIADEATLRGLKLGRAARAAALLRLDEVVDDDTLTRLIGLTPDSALKFRKELVPASPPPVADARKKPMIHQARQRCPALNVGGLVDDIVEINTRITLDLANR